MSKYATTILIAAWLVLAAFAAHAQTENAGASSATAPPIINCTSCHACAMPTAETPCLNPCPYTASENAGPEATPPVVVTIRALSDLYEPVVFNHARHAEMSKMSTGCVACHHYTAKGHTPSCQTCHNDAANPDNLRQPGLRGAYHRQCLGCHREWTGETSCGECHAERKTGAATTVPRADADIIGLKHPTLHPQPTYLYEAGEQLAVTFHHSDHTELFGLKCSDCHQKESCSDCHNTASPMRRKRTDPHEDCIKCHQDRIDNNCESCHSETPLPNFDHARRSGFELTKFHEALSCDRCHAAGDFGGLNATCSTCHAKDWKPENFDHKRTGTVLDDLHIDMECTECHAAFGEKATCAGCHDTQPEPFETIVGMLSKIESKQLEDSASKKN